MSRPLIASISANRLREEAVDWWTHMLNAINSSVRLLCFLIMWVLIHLFFGLDWCVKRVPYQPLPPKDALRQDREFEILPRAQSPWYNGR